MLLREIVQRASLPPIAVFSAHLVAYGLGLYDRAPWLDLPMHLAGGWAIACFFERSLEACERRALLQTAQGLLRFLFLLGLASLAAVLWEGLELLANLALGRDVLDGRQDTVIDLFLGVVGASLYLLLGARRRARLPASA